MHRVVQEALTNVAKHAPGAEAAVRVRHTAEKTEVRVTNGPAPTAVAVRSGGAGFGLIGLDERVGLAGGTFGYGPESGGFAVRATFPRTPAARRAAQAPPHTPDVPDNADGTDAPGSADGAVADDHRVPAAGSAAPSSRPSWCPGRGRPADRGAAGVGHPEGPGVGAGPGRLRPAAHRTGP
ncbi:hypothetical protein GCM10017744_019580 [Streptomyces antimycoticus]